MVVLCPAGFYCIHALLSTLLTSSIVRHCSVQFVFNIGNTWNAPFPSSGKYVLEGKETDDCKAFGHGSGILGRLWAFGSPWCRFQYSRWLWTGLLSLYSKLWSRAICSKIAHLWGKFSESRQWWRAEARSCNLHCQELRDHENTHCLRARFSWYENRVYLVGQVQIGMWLCARSWYVTDKDFPDISNFRRDSLYDDKYWNYVLHHGSMDSLILSLWALSLGFSMYRSSNHVTLIRIRRAMCVERILHISIRRMAQFQTQPVLLAQAPRTPDFMREPGDYLRGRYYVT